MKAVCVNWLTKLKHESQWNVVEPGVLVCGLGYLFFSSFLIFPSSMFFFTHPKHHPASHRTGWFSLSATVLQLLVSLTCVLDTVSSSTLRCCCASYLPSLIHFFLPHLPTVVFVPSYAFIGNSITFPSHRFIHHCYLLTVDTVVCFLLPATFLLPAILSYLAAISFTHALYSFVSIIPPFGLNTLSYSTHTYRILTCPLHSLSLHSLRLSVSRLSLSSSPPSFTRTHSLSPTHTAHIFYRRYLVCCSMWRMYGI